MQNSSSLKEPSNLFPLEIQIPFQLGLSKTDLRRVLKSSLSEVMHIAAATEINSRFAPSLEQLQKSLHSKVWLLPSKFFHCYKDIMHIFFIVIGSLQLVSYPTIKCNARDKTNESPLNIADGGFDFPFNLTKYIPFYGGAEYHDYHHYVGGLSQSNFASVFTYCDYLYGTDRVYVIDFGLAKKYRDASSHQQALCQRYQQSQMTSALPRAIDAYGHLHDKVHGRIKRRLGLAVDRATAKHLFEVINSQEEHFAAKYDNLGVELADLIQGGLIGLLRRIEKFDASRDFRVSTYVYWWIRQNIVESLNISERKVSNATMAMNKVLSLDQQAFRSLSSLPGETLHSPPPPGTLSPDRDGASDLDADKKGLDSETDMVRRGNSEKKDGERTRRGLEINLEDDKVQRILAEELAPKKLTLQLDLEKPSFGEEKSPSERRRQPTLQQQQQKSSKNETKHEKSALEFRAMRRRKMLMT
ncbi:hypothetical protein ABZP36_035710 [Zizania latifolia]